MKKFINFILTLSIILLSDNSFAKAKKRHLKKINKPTKEVNKPVLINIFKEYLLQFDLEQNVCEKIVEGECFRRDGMRDEPYFHKTVVTIFYDSAFATQFLKADENGLQNKVFLMLKDGKHVAQTVNGSLVSFIVKEGVVTDLKLLKGDLKNESDEPTKCEMAQAIYGSVMAYDKSHIILKSLLFKNESDFPGLKELIVFAQRDVENAELFALSKNQQENVSDISRLSLCKKDDFDFLLQRELSRDQCLFGFEEDVQECESYKKCADQIVVKGCAVNFLSSPLQ